MNSTSGLRLKMGSIALVSREYGLVVFGDVSERPGAFYCADSDSSFAGSTFFPKWFSLVDDWNAVEVENEKELMDAVSSEYWIRKTTSYCQQVLAGLGNRELEIEVLQLVEHLLTHMVTLDAVLSRILVAPLRHSVYAVRMTKLALENGLGSVSSLLNAIQENQPLLKRFVNHWLAIPASEFDDGSLSKQEFWNKLSECSRLPQLLRSETKRTLAATWGQLNFDRNFSETTPDRKIIARLATQISDRVFGDQEQTPLSELFVESDELPSVQTENLPGGKLQQRAVLQVEEIVKLISEGKDDRANTFIEQLVKNQLGAGDDKYATKSLCNIAKRSAELFRSDFEKRCLDWAVEISPTDAWTLVQQGDFFKRRGQYERAIEILKKAEILASGETQLVAMSSIADVWSCKRDFEKARQVYMEIDGWEEVPNIRTALADILRFEEHFDEAENEYHEIQKRFLGNRELLARTSAGIAEIKKRRGDLHGSLEMLTSLMRRNEGEIITKLARVNVLVLLGRLKDAFKSIDEVVRESPFHMQARIQRAAIIGMMGDESKAFQQVPDIDLPPGLGEWQRNYVAGMLLLSLDRFDDACNRLVAKLDDAITTRSEEVYLTLGGAFALIMNKNIPGAGKLLQEVGDVNDVYARYIKKLVELSLAIAEKDDARRDEVLLKLRNSPVLTDLLNKLADAVEAGNLEKVRRITVHCFLAAAA